MRTLQTILIAILVALLTISLGLTRHRDSIIEEYRNIDEQYALTILDLNMTIFEYRRAIEMIHATDEWPEIHFSPNDVTEPSNATYRQLSVVLDNTGLEGLEYAYILAEQEYQINAMFLFGITALESAFGNSRLARDKNNISGFGAFDSDPYNNAFTFETKADCIMTTARTLRHNYVDRGLISTIQINSRYATDQGWANKVSSITGRAIKLINDYR